MSTDYDGDISGRQWDLIISRVSSLAGLVATLGGVWIGYHARTGAIATRPPMPGGITLTFPGAQTQLLAAGVLLFVGAAIMLASYR